LKTATSPPSAHSVGILVKTECHPSRVAIAERLLDSPFCKLSRSASRFVFDNPVRLFALVVPVNDNVGEIAWSRTGYGYLHPHPVCRIILGDKQPRDAVGLTHSSGLFQLYVLC